MAWFFHPPWSGDFFVARIVHHEIFPRLALGSHGIQLVT